MNTQTSIPANATPSSDPAASMDRMYRHTRHVYDLSRKFYLLGRDRVIQRIAREVPEGGRVLEVGCGTARNLMKLGGRRGDVGLFGLDASQRMLDTASAKLARRRWAQVGARTTLRQGLAQRLEEVWGDGIGAGFDAVLCSYCLSMIPPWMESVDSAVSVLRPGGCLYVVDFWDQGGWPRWFQSLLRGWLALFHVHHRPELLEYLRSLDGKPVNGRRVSVTIESVHGRYAFVATLRAG